MSLLNVFIIVLVTMLFVGFFIPIVRQVAFHVGALDIPNARKVHTKPIPRLGGLGIYAGFLLSYMLFGFESIQMNAILIGSIIIVITGIIDDPKFNISNSNTPTASQAVGVICLPFCSDSCHLP